MRQLIQHLGSGRTELLGVPAPGPRRGRLLVRATHSLVSLGTERMLVEFGRGSWLSKARQQPEKFRAVLAKARSEGIFTTWRMVRSKLAQPIPLGYCHVGQVLDAGDVPGFAGGDRVVSNSPHAEVVSADPAFAARIPEAVSDEYAAFTPLAAVALQGLRLLDAQPGETVVVMGLGLIGQLAVRLLRARGVHVVGIDPDSAKCATAALAGAVIWSPSAPLPAVLAAGAAGVLLTASTSSDEPVNLAARLCRRHGRVVLVGVTGLALNRADFYQNEVSFQVSRSYGSADSADTSSARVNFDEVLALLASGALDVASLLTSRHAFDEAPKIYDDLRRPGAYGHLIEYAVSNESIARTLPGSDWDSRTTGGVGVIGCGNFAARVLVPELRRQGARRFTVDVNAGRLPADHWTLDPKQGGGRIVGEACHFVDLLRFLSGSTIIAVQALSRDIDGQDGGCFELRFANGDVAVINYRTGQPAYLPKERIAVSGEGWSAEIDNWQSLRSTNLPGATAHPSWLGGPARGKGHAEALAAFLSAVRSSAPAPVSLDEIEEVSRWSIRMQGMKV